MSASSRTIKSPTTQALQKALSKDGSKLCSSLHSAENGKVLLSVLSFRRC